MLSLSSAWHRALLATVISAITLSVARAADEPKWLRVSSSHFAILTNAGEKKGSEVALRLEQMRAICGQLLLKNKLSMPKPLDVIAFRSYEEYVKVARQGVSAQGSLLQGEDRNYILLNLADDESWLAVAHDFAHLFLNYNYPPTQLWFDEGFAQYFSSVRIGERQAQIGGDPNALTGLLTAPPWLPMAALFAAQSDGTHQTGQRDMFHAESWIVMHYLLNQNKLPEAGTYFDLVQNQKVPVEQAISQAFGVGAAQLEKAVRDYFQTLSAADKRAGQGRTALPSGAHEFAPPVGPTEVGSSSVQVSPLEARTLVAEAMLHSKEYRQQAMDELTALTSDSLTDNGIAHRALAWAHLQNNEFEPAGEELREALDFSANDPWTHYYFAWMKYHVAQAEGTMFPGLANMMQDLRIVLDWNTEFAEAYHMLAMARVQGGGINSAIEAIQAAVKLDPRNEDYVLDMARVYTAGKKWDTATALFEHLKSSSSQHIAAAARQSLEDIPTLKKYGLLPQRQPATPPKTVQAKRPGQDSARDEEREEPPTEVAPDKRKVEYLKGKLVSIDCSQAPAAVLRVLKAGKTLRLRTENYKSLLLIGEEDFSCAWQNRTIVANYKAGGKADGDLVSLEVQ